MHINFLIAHCILYPLCSIYALDDSMCCALAANQIMVVLWLPLHRCLP